MMAQNPAIAKTATVLHTLWVRPGSPNQTFQTLGGFPKLELYLGQGNFVSTFIMVIIGVTI